VNAKDKLIEEQKERQIKNLRGKINLQKISFPLLQGFPIVDLRKYAEMAPIR
jgi:hypothetical protein